MDGFDLNNHGSLDQMRAGKWHQPEHPEAAMQRLVTARKLREFNALANTDPVRSRALVAELVNSDGTAEINAPAQLE